MKKKKWVKQRLEGLGGVFRKPCSLGLESGAEGEQHAGKKGEWGCIGGPLPSHTGHLRSASRGLDLLPNYF